ncbi:MAG TPA: cobyric acid synthase [Nitrososphaeraceae archaeon]|nr:cobyric acid synthase [Nitrososphaeraceae archaeon]
MKSKLSQLLMIQGTSSGSGKSTLVTAFCRIFSDKGFRVSPFKAQNMSSNTYIIAGTLLEISQTQALQAFASRKQPDIRMNPILLKPLGDYRSRVILNGRFYSDMHARDYYDNFILQKGFMNVLESLQSLRKENDLVIIEGAGSPAEINISKYDIANMLLAERIRTPVLITADIERGGCFASIVGTMRLLKKIHRDLVQGFIINKFQGDESLLIPAIKSVERITKKRILGIIPRVNFCLPAEDSLDGHNPKSPEMSLESCDGQIDILSKVIKDNVNIEKLILQGIK